MAEATTTQTTLSVAYQSDAGSLDNIRQRRGGIVEWLLHKTRSPGWNVLSIVSLHQVDRARIQIKLLIIASIEILVQVTMSGNKNQTEVGTMLVPECRAPSGGDWVKVEKSKHGVPIETILEHITWL